MIKLASPPRAARTGAGPGRALRFAAWAAGALAFAPCVALGQATAYVPNLDPAYEDLAVLVAAGIVKQALGGHGPSSRAAFGRWAAEAARSLEERGGAAAAVEEAAARLARRFGPDAGERGGGPGRAAAAAVAGASAEIWAARSPSRPLGPGAASQIKGILNPLLNGNQGGPAIDGWTAAAAFSVEAEAGRLAVRVTPQAWVAHSADGRTNAASATLFDGYARAVFGPAALDVGRNHAILGHGRAGGTVLSDNPRGLDMVRVASERPFRLPGGRWGLWRASALVARMESNRDTPRSLLAVFHLGHRPVPAFEWGFVYLNHQAGEGAPSGTLLARLADLLLPVRGGTIEVSDKAGGGHARVTIQRAKTQLYVNFLATDLRRDWRQFLRGYWRDALWTAGASARGLGGEGRLDLWTEARHAGPLVHTHHQFTSGLTLDGRVIGDPLGPNAWSVAAGAAWRAAGWTSRLSVAREHYSADEWRLRREPGKARRQWARIADNEDEVRLRLVVDWRRLPGAGGVETALRLAYERVGNFAFDGSNRDNFVMRLSFGFRPRGA